MQVLSAFIPTHLYIKHHTITGKQYLGKTTSNDPVKYLGSGLLWSKMFKIFFNQGKIYKN